MKISAGPSRGSASGLAGEDAEDEMLDGVVGDDRLDDDGAGLAVADDALFRLLLVRVLP